MKLIYLFLAASLLLLLPACETAENATSDAGDIAGHALAKTGSALQHGGAKLQNATE
jgi:predicted small secreted protein